MLLKRMAETKGLEIGMFRLEIGTDHLVNQMLPPDQDSDIYVTVGLVAISSPTS